MRFVCLCDAYSFGLKFLHKPYAGFHSFCYGCYDLFIYIHHCLITGPFPTAQKDLFQNVHILFVGVRVIGIVSVLWKLISLQAGHYGVVHRDQRRVHNGKHDGEPCGEWVHRVPRRVLGPSV